MAEAGVVQYSERLKQDVDRVIELAGHVTDGLGVSDKFLRRSFKVEAIALTAHWISSFSAASPEMAKWAVLFRKRLERAGDLHAAFSERGQASEASKFIPNREEYYQANGASWQMSESLLVAWTGALNFTSLFSQLRVPLLFGPGQKARDLISFGEVDTAKLDEVYRLSSRSQEFSDLVGRDLNAYLCEVAKIVSESNREFLLATIDSKNSEDRRSKQRSSQLRGRMLWGAAIWCAAFGAVDFDKIWVLQLTRIGVFGCSLWGAFLLRGWMAYLLVIVAIVFNPLLPVRFDRSAWVFVSWLGAVVCGLAGLQLSKQIR
jgi:hypothetical protein